VRARRCLLRPAAPPQGRHPSFVWLSRNETNYICRSDASASRTRPRSATQKSRRDALIPSTRGDKPEREACTVRGLLGPDEVGGPARDQPRRESRASPGRASDEARTCRCGGGDGRAPLLSHSLSALYRLPAAVEEQAPASRAFPPTRVVLEQVEWKPRKLPRRGRLERSKEQKRREPDGVQTRKYAATAADRPRPTATAHDPPKQLYARNPRPPLIAEGQDPA